jgi:hypothetical protein
MYAVAMAVLDADKDITQGCARVLYVNEGGYALPHCIRQSQCLPKCDYQVFNAGLLNSILFTSNL